MLTEDKIAHIFRRSDPHEVEIFTLTFNKYAKLFKFDTSFQVNAFLAELNEEVGLSLSPKRENLNYSCKALKALFGYYKRNPKQANKDGRCQNKANQRAIANNAYGNRLGNKKSNDGWLFRGAGYIQLTGRSNFTQIAKTLSRTLQMEFTAESLAAEMHTIEGALLSAMAFYYTHKMYKAKNINQMTKIVNSKTPTYKQRKKHYLYIASL